MARMKWWERMMIVLALAALMIVLGAIALMFPVH